MVAISNVPTSFNTDANTFTAADKINMEVAPFIPFCAKLLRITIEPTNVPISPSTPSKPLPISVRLNELISTKTSDKSFNAAARITI